MELKYSLFYLGTLCINEYNVWSLNDASHRNKVKCTSVVKLLKTPAHQNHPNSALKCAKISDLYSDKDCTRLGDCICIAKYWPPFHQHCNTTVSTRMFSYSAQI